MGCPMTHLKECFKAKGLVFAFFLIILFIGVMGLNKPLFYLVNSWHVFLPDFVWNIFNTVSYSKLFILPGILLISTWVWRREKILNVLLIVIAYFVVFQIIKVLASEARPYVVLPVDSFYLMSGLQDLAKDAFRSFPSGHAGNAAIFTFTFIKLFLERKSAIRYLMYIFLVMVLFARVCTGWHWPLDVMSSTLIGYIIVQLLYSIKLDTFINKIKK